jgi:hypothetical protein
MLASDHPSPPGACPASAVIMAARQAKTPLAIADAKAPGAPLLFANEAFAAFLDEPAEALVGRALTAFAASSDAPITAPGTTRFELVGKDGSAFPAALSAASVTGADGAPLCLLCSLVDARGDGADEAIDRDAELLAQVAHAASALMRESAIAARLGESNGQTSSASDIALDAVAHATPVAAADRA